MPVSTGKAEWKGTLKEGTGTVESGSGVVSASYSFASRFVDGARGSGDQPPTNPEELIAAAHAACYSMALSNILSTAGHVPDSVATTARVTLEVGADGAGITGIALETSARVPGIAEEAFNEHAEAAKVGCPVSKALASVEITLDATLEA